MRPEDTKPDTPERRQAMAEMLSTMNSEAVAERVLQFVEQVQGSDVPREALLWQLTNIVRDLREGERLLVAHLAHGARP